MKTSFSFYYKSIGIFVLGLLFPFFLQAQSLPDGVLERQLELMIGMDTVSFRYLSVKDSTAMMGLSSKLQPDNYQLCVLRQTELFHYFTLLEKLGTNLYECQQLEQNYTVMDGLNALREKKLFDLIELEKRRSDIYKNAQEEIRQENARLSEQLSLSTEIANKNLKGRLRKNVTLGVLGGVVGFTTGILIGVLATK